MKSFEKSMEELEKLVSDMENDNISLDESIAKFEDGMNLVKECRKVLEDARQKVEKILENGEKAPLDKENE